MDRKDSHLNICLRESVENPLPSRSEEATGFGMYRFDHDALPEVSRAEIKLATRFLGKDLAAPLIIGAMTGGTPRAAEINQRLAIAAERCQVGFALGSQRKMLDAPHDQAVLASYAVKNHAPSLPLLIGNLGAVQLNDGVTFLQLNALVRDAGCDAFNFHLNPLQEAIQPGGDTDFRGLIAKLHDAISQMDTPVLLKEVGAGISEITASKIRALPLSGIETAGVGGTSWSRIESLRTDDPIRRNAGELFARWGIPTAESIVACRKYLPNLPLVASGGIRNGIEVAKAIALGADVVAVALPILKAADRSLDDAVQAIQQIMEELRITMFLTGSRELNQLRERPLRRTRDLTS